MHGVACNSRLPQAKGSKGLPITFCNNTTSYLSPFSKLAKGNGAPHATSVKLHAVLNYPRKFAKRAQITFGDFAKGYLLPFGIY